MNTVHTGKVSAMRWFNTPSLSIFEWLFNSCPYRKKSVLSELILNMEASMDTEILHKNPLKYHPDSSE